MAELTTLERLQPSLLDRLTDDAPDQGVESRERRVLSMRALRQAVLRDLSWLLNTSNLATTQPAIAGFAHVANSVVNFGMPDIAGKSVSGFRLEDLERSLRQAIWDFEPRIIRSTVLVRALANDSDHCRYNIIRFEIELDLWAVPYPERLYLKTELDLEAGSIRITEQG
jgi:type VI secretion system protein ImpF